MTTQNRTRKSQTRLDERDPVDSKGGERNEARARQLCKALRIESAAVTVISLGVYGLCTVLLSPTPMAFFTLLLLTGLALFNLMVRVR